MEITVREISERLALDSERICQMLLPGGRLEKGQWLCGDLAGGPGDSLKVNLSGPHAGHWRDWASDDDKGDLIDLWRAVKGSSAADTIKMVKEWLGIAPTIFSPSEKSYKDAPDRPEIQDLNPNGRAMQFLTQHRGLRADIVNRFRIQGVDRAIVFPCYDPRGRLVNRSYRTLGAEKKVWQDTGCAPCLFGWHALSEDAYKTRTVLLCEGQIDAATWTQWGIPALSIPNGSGQTWITSEWDNLAAFDQIYVSFDMDSAGISIAEKAIQRLGKHRCLIVRLPHKDANDCLLKGYGPEHAQEWIAEAKTPEMKGLVTANELERRLISAMQPQKPSFTLPFLKKGSNGDGLFFRPGEVTVWTGVTSNGKSTFLNYLFLSLLCVGTPVFIASMEAKAETILRKMMAAFCGHDPSENDVKEFLERVGHLLLFADVVGYISQKELLEMMQFAQRRYGVAHCLIDSLMRVDGLEEDYVQQGKFLNELQAIAKPSGVHMHLVAHPRKMSEDGKPGKMDVKGSSLIPNNADNLVTVCRNAEKDKLQKEDSLTPMQNEAMYDAEIRVEKQRETGWVGRFLLKFDPITFSYSSLPVPSEKPSRERTK